MPKSPFAHAVDSIQRELKPRLAKKGFSSRRGIYNRRTPDGLIHVVSLQMGRSDPPGTTYIPGLRENFHGRFTVNLGVYVPEVGRALVPAAANEWIPEYDCCIRERLGMLAHGQDTWWPCRADDEVVDQVWGCLERVGFPYLEKFESREAILTEDIGHARPPRIVRAIILAERGDREGARVLLTQQVLASEDNVGHQDYVRALAEKIGVGRLQI